MSLHRPKLCSHIYFYFSAPSNDPLRERLPGRRRFHSSSENLHMESVRLLANFTRWAGYTQRTVRSPRSRHRV